MWLRSHSWYNGQNRLLRCHLYRTFKPFCKQLTTSNYFYGLYAILIFFYFIAARRCYGATGTIHIWSQQNFGLTPRSFLFIYRIHAISFLLSAFLGHPPLTHCRYHMCMLSQWEIKVTQVECWNPRNKRKISAWDLAWKTIWESILILLQVKTTHFYPLFSVLEISDKNSIHF